MSGVPLSSLAGQAFQEGSDYLLSIANQARKAYCGYVALDNSIPDVVDLTPPPLRALQNEFVRRVCELPDDPVPLPPAPRSPSNAGKCECLAYKIKGYYQEQGSEPIQFSNEVYGPITPYSRTVGAAPNVQTQVGYTHRGIYGGGCQPTTQDNIVRSAGIQYNLTMVLTSITPYAPNPPAPTDCSRPTLPTDNTTRKGPSVPPSVNIPVPNLPDINIPVLPVPLPVAPNVSFEPKLVIDVGGINISFTMGDVEFSFNPNINAPITLFPPGYQQPALPPSVEPLPPQGGKDCCDEIFKRFNTVDSNLFKVDLATQGIKDDTANIKTVQNASVVPLLKDIQECVCLPDAQLFATYTNVQDIIFPAGDEEVAFAVVRLIGEGDEKKRFQTPGGEPVVMCGWYAFGRSGRWFDRHALQYKDNIMIPPSRGTNTFTFSVYNGLRANCQIFTYKKETT